jgi:hypothetical protein
MLLLWQGMSDAAEQTAAADRAGITVFRGMLPSEPARQLSYSVRLSATSLLDVASTGSGMRQPVVHGGRDGRPVRLWEDWIVLLVTPLILAAVLLVLAFRIGLVLGWAVVSPVIPRSWRQGWGKAFAFFPSAAAECPACHAGLVQGQADSNGHRFRTDQGREITLPTQGAACPHCRRLYHRFKLGKVWSSWYEADA